MFPWVAGAKVKVLFKAVVGVCFPKENELVTFSFCSAHWWKSGGVSFILCTGVSWKDQKCTLDGESKGCAQSPALPLWPSATKADPCYFASRLLVALCQQPTFFFFFFFFKFGLQINNFTFAPISIVQIGRRRVVSLSGESAAAHLLTGSQRQKFVLVMFLIWSLCSPSHSVQNYLTLQANDILATPSVLRFLLMLSLLMGKILNVLRNQSAACWPGESLGLWKKKKKGERKKNGNCALLFSLLCSCAKHGNSSVRCTSVPSFLFFPAPFEQGVPIEKNDGGRSALQKIAHL